MVIGRRREYLSAVLFLLPTFIGLLVFRLYPVGRALFQSLLSDSIRGAFFVGLRNYEHLFRDPGFWNSFWVTIKFNLLVNPIQIAIALLLALLFTRRKRGERFFRTVMMIPIGMSVSVASIIWVILLNPNNGIVNGILALVRIPNQPFFTNVRQALWCIIFLASWKGVAFWMIFLIAGLQDIPESIYEAAEIDGTNLIQRIVYLTLPLLRRMILFVLVADTSINFILFAPSYIITKGGPEGSTNVLMYEAYQNGFIYGYLGKSMAIITIILITVLIIIGIQFRLLRSEN